MAACGSLQPIFDSTLPDNSSILESLSSWKNHHHLRRHQIMPSHSDDDGREPDPVDCQASSIAEIFGELHFKERDPEPSSLPPPPPSTTMELESNGDGEGGENAKSPSSMSSRGGGHGHHRSSESFSSMNSESLQLCTEGLGFESFGDVEDYKLAEASQGKEAKESAATCPTRRNFYSSSSSFKHRPQYFPHNHRLHEFRRSRSIGSGYRGFPPPISSLSMSGKPWVCFKSYRNDGRFVLKEIRFPTQEFLHASREGGRLTLQFVHPSDEIEEDEGILEDDSDEEDDEDGEREDGGRGENSDVEHEKEEKREEACRVDVGRGGDS